MKRNRLLVVAGLVTVATVGMGLAHANGSSPSGIPDGMTVTSESHMSQSMVEGSSPTSLGSSSLAKTPAGKAAAVAAADDVDPADVTTSVTVQLYDPKTGTVLAHKRYGPKSEGKRLKMPKPPLAGHGTGGTSSIHGCGRVFVTQKLHDGTGLQTLGKWQIWTDWCWLRGTQIVQINDKDINQDHGFPWFYDGVQTEFNENHFYDFSVNDNHPLSAYMFVRQAAFHGPSIFAGHDAQWTPKNSLASYYNGTWQWWTST